MTETTDTSANPPAAVRAPGGRPESGWMAPFWIALLGSLAFFAQQMVTYS